MALIIIGSFFTFDIECAYKKNWPIQLVGLFGFGLIWCNVRICKIVHALRMAVDIGKT